MGSAWLFGMKSGRAISSRKMDTVDWEERLDADSGADVITITRL